MSYPILYSATETNFDNNGIGILSACVSCKVIEEANGIFELAMTYPMDGIHFSEIDDRTIIKAKVDKFRNPQLFRVYAISKPLSGIVTVLAEHISYDLSGIPVSPFVAVNAKNALAGFRENAAVECPFDFWTDKDVDAVFEVKAPASIRSRLGGVEGSILDRYGGEYEFDNFTVKLHKNRGKDRGVTIRYGKNLTDIKQEQNCSSVATGVYPYWASSDGVSLVQLPEKIVNAPGNYNFVRIKTVDFSQDFEEQPTVEQLRNATKSYIDRNEIGVPNVSFTVSFVQIDQFDGVNVPKDIETVCLFDTLSVEFMNLAISARAKVVKTVYDVISERMESISLGSVRSNIADTIYEQGANASTIAHNEAVSVVKGQTSEDVFNRLTDNGRIQGIKIQDDRWYINAELVKIANLIADRLRSDFDDSYLIAEGASLSMFYDNIRTFHLENRFGADAYAVFRSFNDDGVMQSAVEITPTKLGIGGAGTVRMIDLGVDLENKPYLILGDTSKDMPLNLEWKDNGDGTYNLIGRGRTNIANDLS